MQHDREASVGRKVTTKAKKHVATRAPRTDAQTSGRNYGLPKAATFKKTSPYAAAITAAHHQAEHATAARMGAVVARDLHLQQQLEGLGHGGTDAGKWALQGLGNLYDRVAPDDGGGALATVRGVGGSGGSHVLSNILKTSLHHPESLGHTLAGARDTMAAIPAGLVAAIHDPLGTGAAMVKHFRDTYAGETDAQQQARMAEHGFSGEVLDAMTAATAGGTTLARGALAGARKFSEDGSYLNKLVSEPRPNLRTGGGKSVPQSLADRPLRVAAQRNLDWRRARRDAKVVDFARATNKDAPVARVLARDSKGAEVSPRYDASASKAVRWGVALAKSRAVNRFKSEERIKLHQFAARHLHSLSRHERTAFYYAYAGLAPADHPLGAIENLTKLEQDIAAARTAPVGRVDQLHEIADLKANAHEAFTPHLKDVVNQLRVQDIHIGRSDPSLTAAQRLTRRYAQQAEHLGIRRGDLGGDPLPGDVPDMAYSQESVPDYIRRVQEAADAHGLGRPGYFPSEKYAHPNYSVHTVGGAMARREDFKYTGKLFREGRQITTPDVYLTGLARSISRKHNWGLVADHFDLNTIPGLRNMTMRQLKGELDKRHIDINSVKFWHPGRFRKQLAAVQASDVPGVGREAVDLEHANPYGDAVTNSEEFQLERLTNAVHHAQDAPAPDSPEYGPVTVPALGTDAHAAYVKTQGWSAIPKAAHDEIHGGLDQSWAMRAGHNLFKALPSRVLLSMNPKWNIFQILSNIGIGALATLHSPSGFAKGGLPVALLRQYRLYRSLDDATKTEVDAVLGEGAGSHGNRYRMGSHGGKTAIGRKYGQLKAWGGWHAQGHTKSGRAVTPSLSQVNPVDLGFKIDHAQNQVFRRALLFHSMKSYGEKLTPARVKQIMSDPVEAERHAKFTNDWLGDYSTYTTKERKFQAFPLTPVFYGYLRHSLNLMARTIPRDAPLAGEAMLALGRLQHDEQVKLGVDKLPWAAGKFYWTDSNNQVHEYDLQRSNPALNALTSIHNPSEMIGGLVSPVVASGYDIFNHRSSYKDKNWAVGGNPVGFAPKWADYSWDERLRAAFKSVADLSPVYRAAEAHTLFGPQGDDSLPWDPRPTIHKDTALKHRDQLWAAQDHADSSWLRDIVPLPKVSQDPSIAKTYGLKSAKHSSGVKSHGHSRSSGRAGGRN